MALKETPSLLPAPTITVDLKEYSKIVSKAENFDHLENTTRSMDISAAGDWIEYRTNSATVDAVMQGVGLILKHKRYKSIVEDLIKIAEGKK